jgi:hypothetical protein
MVFSIQILNSSNDGNNVKMYARGMFLGPNLLHGFMNSLTLKPTIHVVLPSSNSMA